VQNPFDDNDITFQDCFEGNLWLISQTYTPESILDPEGTVDEDDDKALIENFIDKVGSPNYFAPCLNSFDEFNSARHNENSLQSYYIGWVFDDYAIIVTAYDGIFYDENTFEISFIEYMPIEWWNYLQDNSDDMSFKENVIEKLAASNGVTLANTPATKTDVVTSVGIDPDKFEIPSSEKYKHDLSMMNLESDSNYPDAVTVTYNDFTIDLTASTTPDQVRAAMDEEPQEDSNNINQYLSYGDLSGWWDAVDFSWYNGDEEHLHDSTIRFTSKYYTVSMMGVTKDSTPYDIAAIFGTPNVSDVTYAGGGNYDEVQTLYWDDIEIAGQAIYSLVVEYYNGELYSMTVSFD
jgi:hypothetical protein